MKKLLHKQTSAKCEALPNKVNTSANTETTNDPFDDETYLGKVSMNDISTTKVDRSQSFDDAMNENKMLNYDAEFQVPSVERITIPTRYM